jgi:hypothetical protein
MVKLILGIICTIITPIVMIKNIREVRKYESSFRNSSPKSDYQTGDLNKTRVVVAIFIFLIGLYLLYEYFFLPNSNSLAA